jgi:hypothetical protein
MSSTAKKDSKTIPTAASSVRPIVGSKVFELCKFDSFKRPQFVGYFDDIEEADKYIAKNQKSDIYLTPQILNPSLIQRGHNKMVKTGINKS